MNNRIVVAVGSTGGHFFPGLRIAQHLREKYSIETILLGPIKTEFQNILNSEKFPFVSLKIPTGQKNAVTRVLFYYSAILKAVLKSFFFLQRTKPALVVGTGSFGSFPACMSAYFLGIPFFINEQNIIPGKANKFLGRFAKKIFLAFPNSYFQPYKTKTLVIGNLVKKHKLDLGEEYYEKFGLDINKKTLLIFGGSQGAFSLNSWFVNILNRVENLEDWQVIHITGRSDYERIKKRYMNLKIRSAVLPFLYPLDYVYRISDLAISRGGALSLSELSFWGIPALIIPYSHAKDNHQERNALYFQKKGGVYLLGQKDLEESNFLKILQELLNDSDKLKSMSGNIKKILPDDALEAICKEIQKYIKN